MARRKSRRKNSKRRTKQKLNLLGVAEAAILAGAFTQGAFGVQLVPFLFEGWLVKGTSATNMPNEISLNNLVRGVIPGGEEWSGSMPTKSTLWESIEDNLRNNGPRMVGTLILTPIAFKAVKQLTKKPRSMANRMLKMGQVPLTV